MDWLKTDPKKIKEQKRTNALKLTYIEKFGEESLNSYLKWYSKTVMGLPGFDDLFTGLALDEIAKAGWNKEKLIKKHRSKK